MEFRLKFDDAERLASATLAASNDMARPTLAAVKLEIKDGRITSTATDSYRMSVGNFPVMTDQGVTGGLLVNAQQFRRALVEAVKQQRPFAKFAGAGEKASVKVWEDGDYSVIVASDGGTLRVDKLDADTQYPKVQKFIDKLPAVLRDVFTLGGTPVSAAEIAASAEANRVAPVEAANKDFRGGFSAEYLTELGKIVGRTKGLRGRVQVMPFLDEPGKPSWFMWAYNNGAAEYGNGAYLLMPARV